MIGACDHLTLFTLSLGDLHVLLQIPTKIFFVNIVSIL